MAASVQPSSPCAGQNSPTILATRNGPAPQDPVGVVLARVALEGLRPSDASSTITLRDKSAATRLAVSRANVLAVLGASERRTGGSRILRGPARRGSCEVAA